MRNFLLTAFVFAISVTGLSVLSQKAENDSDFVFGASDISTGKQINVKSEKVLDSLEVNTAKGKILKIAYESDTKIEKKELEIERGTNYYKEKVSRDGNVYTFYPEDQFWFNEQNEWKQIEFATSTITKKTSLLKTVFPVFREARAQTNYMVGAGDGYLQNRSTSWSTARTADPANYAVVGTATVGNSMRAEKSGSYYWVHRAFDPADTSAITDTDTVVSSTIYIFTPTGYKADVDGSGSVVFFNSGQANPASLATADMDQCTGTEITNRKTVASASENAYNSFPILAASLSSVINVTGYTKVCGRHSRDIDNSAPTGDNALGQYFSEQTGTDTDPFIRVYTTSGGATYVPVIQPKVFIINSY